MLYFLIIAFLLFIAVIAAKSFIKFNIPGISPSPTPPQDYNLKDITIKDIDKMNDGSDFELYLYRLFLALEYENVYKTVDSRDFGADLVFTDRDRFVNVIQAKRYSPDNLVGISAVQEVYSSMKYYGAKKSTVISSSKYTDPCETLAGVNSVKLIDRNDLIKIIEYFKSSEIDKAKDLIESEPRQIHKTWSEMQNPYGEMKKDKKAERLYKNQVNL